MKNYSIQELGTIYGFRHPLLILECALHRSKNKSVSVLGAGVEYKEAQEIWGSDEKRMILILIELPIVS